MLLRTKPLGPTVVNAIRVKDFHIVQFGDYQPTFLHSKSLQYRITSNSIHPPLLMPAFRQIRCLICAHIQSPKFNPTLGHKNSFHIIYNFSSWVLQFTDFRTPSKIVTIGALAEKLVLLMSRNKPNAAQKKTNKAEKEERNLSLFFCNCQL